MSASMNAGLVLCGVIIIGVNGKNIHEEKFEGIFTNQAAIIHANLFRHFLYITY